MSRYFTEALRLARKVRDAQHERNDSVYASDASVELTIGDETLVHGQCLRSQWYRLTDTPISDPPSDEERFVAQVGELMHTAVARTFADAEQLVRDEWRLWMPEIRLSGRCDLLIRPRSDGAKVGMEVKTVGGYYGRKGCIDTTRNTPLYPRLKDLCQTVIYAEKFKEEFQEWVLLYIDREFGTHREHEIVYQGHDQILVNGEPSSVTPQAVYLRWERLWAHVKSKTLPARDYALRYSPERIQRLFDQGKLNKEEKERVKTGRKVDKGDKECREWCPWRTQCWKVDTDKE